MTAITTAKRADKALTIYEQMGMQMGLLPEQLFELLRPTPKKYIYTRPGRGGGTWNYVKASYIQKKLDFVFGWDWNFQIVDKGREGNVVWVQGRLTVTLPSGRTIIKEQFGRAEVKFKQGTTVPLDYGNDLKASASDALKKCASQLGLARDVYNPDEYQEVSEATIDPDAITSSQRVLLAQLSDKTNTEIVPEPKTKDEADEAIARLTKEVERGKSR